MVVCLPACLHSRHPVCVLVILIASLAGSGVEALLSPMEAAMVDELNTELRQTLRDYR